MPSTNSRFLRWALPSRIINWFASRPAITTIFLPKAFTSKTGPSLRYCLVKKARRSPLSWKAWPATGSPPEARGHPPPCSRMTRVRAWDSAMLRLRMASVTDRPTSSRRASNSIRSRTSSYSSRSSICRNMSQALARLMRMQSRGAGMPSLYSTSRRRVWISWLEAPARARCGG